MGRALLALLFLVPRAFGALWPEVEICETLQSQHPGQRMGEVLSQFADQVVTSVPQLGELPALRQTSSFQEMSWVLAKAGHHELSAALALRLGCFFLTAEVREEAVLAGGATESKQVFFSELNLVGVFKPWQRNLSASVGSEVGAYRIDRLLGLGVVPLTVRRSLYARSMVGSLQYFVKGCIGGNKLAPPQQVKTAEMLVLDYLVKNIDRDPKNYLWHPTLQRLIAIDNGWCLRGNNPFALVKALFVDKRNAAEKELKFGPGQLPRPELVERLRSLSEGEVRKALEGVVTERGLVKLIKRKEKVLRAITKG
jgi:hypothetical protein